MCVCVCTCVCVCVCANPSAIKRESTEWTVVRRPRDSSKSSLVYDS